MANPVSGLFASNVVRMNPLIVAYTMENGTAMGNVAMKCEKWINIVHTDEKGRIRW